MIKKHDCVIGIWSFYEDTSLMNKEEFLDKIEYEKDYHEHKKEIGFLSKDAKPYTLKDYLYTDKTNFTRFNYCPFCGKKIDFEIIERENSKKESDK